MAAPVIPARVRHFIVLLAAIVVMLPTVQGRDRDNWVPVLQESFESGMDIWSALDSNVGCGFDYWGISTVRAHTGGASVWCSEVGDNCGTGAPNVDEGRYDYLQDTWLVYGGDNGFSLLDAERATLGFYAWYVMEGTSYPCPDYLQYGVSLDGSSFYGGTLCGTSAGAWARVELDLGNLPGIGSVLHQTRIWLGFRFHSNITDDPYEGVYLDDITILKDLDTPTPTLTPTFSPTPTWSPTATPTRTPTRTATNSPTLSPTVTPTLSPTLTPSASPTRTPSASSTVTVTPTKTATATSTPTTTSTPTSTGTPTPNLELNFECNSETYRPNDAFELTYEVINPSTFTYNCDAYFILQIGSIYLFHPNYTEDVQSTPMVILPGRLGPTALFSFSWPEGAGWGEAYFWFALTEKDNIYGVFGYDYTHFTWADNAATPTPTNVPTTVGTPTRTTTPTPVNTTPTPTCVPVTVPGTQSMVATNIVLSAGASITIDASGWICFYRDVCDQTRVGPEGWDQYCNDAVECSDQPYNNPPGYHHGALLGYVESNPYPFFVGTHYQGAPGSGALYLGLNDGDTSNNDGVFSACISVGH